MQGEQVVLAPSPWPSMTLLLALPSVCLPSHDQDWVVALHPQHL